MQVCATNSWLTAEALGTRLFSMLKAQIDNIHEPTKTASDMRWSLRADWLSPAVSKVYRRWAAVLITVETNKAISVAHVAVSTGWVRRNNVQYRLVDTPPIETKRAARAGAVVEHNSHPLTEEDRAGTVTAVLM